MSSYTMQMAAEKVSENLAKALQSAKKTKPTSAPAAQLLASMPRQPLLRQTQSQATDVLAAHVTTIITRNNANLKGTPK